MGHRSHDQASTLSQISPSIVWVVKHEYCRTESVAISLFRAGMIESRDRPTVPLY